MHKKWYVNLATMYTHKFNYSCHNRICIYCEKNSTIVFGDKNVRKIQFVSNFLFTSLSIIYISSQSYFSWWIFFILFIYFSLTYNLQSQANGYFWQLRVSGCSHYLLCRLQNSIISLEKKDHNYKNIPTYRMNNDDDNNINMNSIYNQWFYWPIETIG